MKVKLKMEASLLPLIDLPADVELLLLLIREDLKAHKLAECLNALGGGGSPYQADLTDVVLIAAGFKDWPNEVYDFYFQLLHKYSAELNGSNTELMKTVMKVYHELVRYNEQ